MTETTFEPILLTIPGNTGDKVNVNILEEEKFNHGGQKPKSRIHGHAVVDELKIPVNLVKRKFGIEGEDTDRIFAIWEYCHENNGPVMPIMARDDNGYVYMPDLEADGSKIYGRSINVHMDGGQGELRRYEPDDHLFINLMNNPESVKVIEEKAKETVRWFNDHEILLQSDEDPLDLILHPDGSFEVIALDIERISRMSDNFPEERKLQNNESISTLMTQLIKAKTRLEKYRELPNAKTIRKS